MAFGPKRDPPGSVGAGRRASATETLSKAPSAARRARDPTKSSGVTEQEVQRIWQKLDPNNKGSIRIADIVKHGPYLKQTCPKLIEGYRRISKGGVVGLDDVRRLLLGAPDSKLKQQTDKSQKIEPGDLRALFDQLANSDGVITLDSVIDSKDVIMKKFPALIDEFEKIDLTGSLTISWNELRVFAGGTAEWLEHEFESIVGLEQLKDQVRSFYRSLVLDQARRQQGHQVKGLGKGPHMIFQGNPGTGKTSLGRLMAKLLHRIGVIGTPELREVQRPDLVAEHVGQTGPKTKQVIENSRKGVLFIDEAYRLTSVDSKTDFGREAVETLMEAMNHPPGKAPVMIFAGYVEDMQNFTRANEGLYRRIGYSFEFTDYNPSDLALIFQLLVEGQGFELDSPLLSENRRLLATIIATNTQPRTRALMNGGLCERIFAGAKQHLDARDDPTNPSIVLSVEDINQACCEIPPPPEPTTAGSRPTQSSDAQTGVPCSAPTMFPTGEAVSVQSLGKNGKNLWVYLGNADDLKGWSPPRSCFSRQQAPLDFSVSIRLDSKEVHRSAGRSPGAQGPSWEELKIFPYQEQSLLEFALIHRDRKKREQFVGSGVLALRDLTSFSGALELKAADCIVGVLRLKTGWQFIVGTTGPYDPDKLKDLKMH